jgi:hypothetical protein
MEFMNGFSCGGKFSVARTVTAADRDTGSKLIGYGACWSYDGRTVPSMNNRVGGNVIGHGAIWSYDGRTVPRI